jgi:hypothetical protein
VIEFEWSDDVVEGQHVWWVGCTQATGQDKVHEKEIMEQLDAHGVGWA